MKTEMLDRLVAKVSVMQEKEIVAGLYKDQLTGLWNRRALEEIPHKGPVAIADVDCLKWINDHLGYRYGDLSIQQLAQALETQFPDRTYRLGGDEFAVLADTMGDLLYGLLKARTEVDSLNLESERYYMFNSARFSFGMGENLVQADRALKVDKLAREAMGHRAKRGEMPKDTFSQVAV